MKLQRLIYYGIKAIKKYNMIQDGDKIAVGLSGGKDSLTLLILLAHLKNYMKYNIEVMGIAVDCFGDIDYSCLEKKCNELGVEFVVVRTDIAKIIFGERKEKNPCSLCSKMRKSALYNVAEENACTKIALGHNQDDVLQTFFMSLLEEGRLHTFENVKKLEKVKCDVIRPLIYAPEKEIVGFINKYELNRYIIKSKCPADGKTKREEMKEFMKELRKKYDKLDDKLMGAIEKANLDGYKI